VIESDGRRAAFDIYSGCCATHRLPRREVDDEIAA
jgi:hypothetical protein